ncbi:MAG: phosphoenolpyruvate--protein phosphotransferase [Gammaproteobacteria bacterium]
MTFSLHGLAVSRGYAIGRVHIVSTDEIIVNEYSIERDEASAEVARLMDAVHEARRQLRQVRTQLPSTTSADIAAFIDVHLMMIEDEALTENAAKAVKEKLCNAEWALKIQRDELVTAFQEMADPYLRERKDDVDQVINRIQRILLNHAPLQHEIDGRSVQGMILIADDLSPADTVLMDHNKIAAFVTDSGGPTSHTSILARSLGIPGVAGVHGVRNFVTENETVIVDGFQGVLIGEPDDKILDYYRDKQANFEGQKERLAIFRETRTVTKDGRPISLNANVELPADFEMAMQVGASGVGLYRTEFMYMNRRDFPGEKEHFETYRDLVQSFGGVPVTIRTLDLGADKAFHEKPGESIEINPALGLRAIRLSLREPELYWPQLRAIVRASAYGPVRLMIPMLSNIDEALQVVQNIRSVQQGLAEKGIEFDAEMPIGAMIEVPAAALCAESFAEVLDFFSIGTNDLIQYTIAIDRVNDEVNYLYNPLHPAVLRLISMTIEAGNKAAIPVAMCGEMASDTRYTKLLLAMGLKEFSVHPSMILEVRKVITETNVDEIQPALSELLKDYSRKEFEAELSKLIC